MGLQHHWTQSPPDQQISWKLRWCPAGWSFHPQSMQHQGTLPWLKGYDLPTRPGLGYLPKAVVRCCQGPTQWLKFILITGMSIVHTWATISSLLKSLPWVLAQTSTSWQPGTFRNFGFIIEEKVGASSSANSRGKPTLFSNDFKRCLLNCRNSSPIA